MKSNAVYGIACVVSALVSGCVGFALGSFVTAKKYEAIIDEDIESVKKAYSSQSQKTPSVGEKLVKEVNTEDTRDYVNILKTSEYVNYSNYKDADMDYPSDKKEDPIGSVIEVSEVEQGDEPYPIVISGKEFGDNEDYEIISLIYYSDNILADDNDNIVDDAAHCIGLKAIAALLDEDVVYVQNDKRMCYYEVSRAITPYSDVLRSKPYLRELV